MLRTGAVVPADQAHIPLHLDDPVEHIPYIASVKHHIPGLGGMGQPVNPHLGSAVVEHGFHADAHRGVDHPAFFLQLLFKGGMGDHGTSLSAFTPYLAMAASAAARIRGA